MLGEGKVLVQPEEELFSPEEISHSSKGSLDDFAEGARAEE